MREEGRISSYQGANFIIAIILPTAILFLPSRVAGIAMQDAWLSFVIALGPGLAVAYLAARVALRFPRETVIQFLPRLVGPVLGKIIGLVFIGYLFLITFIVQREFAELMTELFYLRTPPFVFVGLLTLLAVYAVYKGLEVLARVNDLIILLLLGSILFFLMVVGKDLRVEELSPLLEQGMGRVLLGAVTPMAWFGETVVIMMLVPFLTDKVKAVKANMAAIGIVFTALFVIMIGTLGIMGAKETAAFSFASFAVVRRVEFVGIEFFQRQDALFMALWVGAMLMKLGAFLYVTVLAFSQWFGLRSYRPVVLPLAILLAAFSMQSWDNNTEFTVFTGQVVPLIISAVAYGMTALLFLVSLFRPENRNG